MKVILTQDIEKLGKKGDIKEVADGYARNFLFPGNFARPATETTLKEINKEKTRKEKKKSDEITRFEELAKKLNGMELTFNIAIGEMGQSFGSVSTKDITEELKKNKIAVNEDWIELEEPLKKTGGWDIKIKLPHGFAVAIKVTVEAKKEEVKKRGRPRVNIEKSKITMPNLKQSELT